MGKNKDKKNFNFIGVTALLFLILIVIIVLDIGFFKNRCRGTKMYYLDAFNGTVEPGSYDWFDEDEVDSHTRIDGHMRISAGRGQDLWGGGEKRGAPLLLRRAPDCKNYSIETFVRAGSITAPNQTLNTQSGLFVFEDEDNWFFFGLTNHDFTIGGDRSRQDGLIITQTGDGNSSIFEQMDFDDDGVYLKITKKENDWWCYWKRHQGDGWQLLGVPNLRFGEHKVGLGLKTFDLFTELYGPADAYFDYFLISED